MMAFTMADDEHRWVRMKWGAIRDAQMAADKAQNEWQSLSASINAKLDAEGVTDIVARATRRGASLMLRDYLNSADWHCRNAERHIHDLSLFIKMKESGLL